MKGKTSIGADLLCERYIPVLKYGSWDEFFTAMMNLDRYPKCVFINGVLHALVQRNAEEK